MKQKGAADKLDLLYKSLNQPVLGMLIRNSICEGNTSCYTIILKLLGPKLLSVIHTKGFD